MNGLTHDFLFDFSKFYTKERRVLKNISLENEGSFWKILLAFRNITRVLQLTPTILSRMISTSAPFSRKNKRNLIQLEFIFNKLFIPQFDSQQINHGTFMHPLISFISCPTRLNIYELVIRYDFCLFPSLSVILYHYTILHFIDV